MRICVLERRDHVRRRIDAHYALDMGSQLGGQSTFAAADVEDLVCGR
jgi:hypothetical protein